MLTCEQVIEYTKTMSDHWSFIRIYIDNVKIEALKLIKSINYALKTELNRKA